MKQKFLHRINIILGILSLGLAGCHSSKPAAVVDDRPQQMLKYGVPPEVYVLYGVPVDYDPNAFPVPQDTIQQQQ